MGDGEEQVIGPGDIQELRIVEGVAVSSGQGGQKTDLSRKIEQAMSEAILKANEEGISVNDTEELQKRMQVARQKVLDEHYGRTSTEG